MNKFGRWEYCFAFVGAFKKILALSNCESLGGKYLR